MLLTNGSLEGLGLLARHLADGRPAVAEYPVSNRAERAILDARIVLSSIGIDESGMNTDELRQMLSEYRRPSLIYTISSFHNPTGHTMSFERRSALVGLVRTQNLLQAEQIVLLEDDAYGLTRFEGERIPALFDISAKAAAYSSSFSTTIAPGLRVGFLIVTEPLAAALAAEANATYISPRSSARRPSSSSSGAGASRRTSAGSERVCESAVTRCSTRSPSTSPTGPGRGRKGASSCGWNFRSEPTARTFAGRAGTREAVPGTSFAWTANAIRLSFAYASPDEVAAGVERLADARAELEA